ncbi:MAG TPA: hypothetical protein VM490_21785 [Armatimonadaceae bacterium]|nr:hypothetical protein [Armatimonadaceae bacterium]
MLGKVEEVPGLTAGAISLRDEMSGGGMKVLQKMEAGDATLEVCHGRDTLWLLVRRGGGKGKKGGGGFALRTAHSPGMPLKVERTQAKDGTPLFVADTAIGTFTVRLSVPDPAVSLVRCTVHLTPSDDLLIPFLPRDLYPFDENGDPAGTEGCIHAGQRGLNAGLLYLSMAKPRFGSLLYFQDLTSLNDYFLATETKPDGVVRGKWPELGYQPPTKPGAQEPPEKPLPAGKEVVLSDALLHWSEQMPEDPRESARLFLDLLAGVYPFLNRPETEFHDWPRLAEKTAKDLDASPKATIAHYGKRYVHPYTDSEYPDSMVQLAVSVPMREYGRWRSFDGGEAGRAGELSQELLSGMGRFYDPELKAVRRYLPNVGDDKNANEVDSWYLYHPLANLGRLAKDGDGKARELFFNSLEFAIKAARHFKYVWPVQYDITNFEIIKDERKEDEPGQSDVGGLYAYVMLEAWDMTRDPRYLDEAKNAIQAMKDMEFELTYQTNITAWGVNACVRLWRLTEDPFFRDQSLVFLAGYFHNCILWESRLENAARYRTFLGATCLHDGPYMAVYECYESFAAFEEYLSLGQDDLPDSVHLLTSEYYKYTLTRAWYFYPGHLPVDALAKDDIRNGHIDRALAFPLEDLYADGQPAGQVGQELYGCGAAFTFASRAFHRIEGAPFLFFCEYPMAALELTEKGQVSLQARGARGYACKARIIPLGRRSLPSVSLSREDQTGRPNRELRGQVTEEGHCEFTIPASEQLLLRWEE